MIDIGVAKDKRARTGDEQQIDGCDQADAPSGWWMRRWWGSGPKTETGAKAMTAMTIAAARTSRRT